jgi:hypothetical protein
MRWALSVIAVLLLTRCSSLSSYDANADQSSSSLTGSQGGGGVQAPIWSTDKNKSTVSTAISPSQ